MAQTGFQFDNYLRELFPYAYNILGIAEDAEDVVQEVMMNWQQVDAGKVENPRAYLIRSVVNRAINQKEKNKKERQNYTGNWLPEPVYTDRAFDRLDSEHILNYSMLVLLEKLNAKERAVLILRESFDYSYADISQALGLNEDHCRQLLKRAKDKVGPITVRPEKFAGQTERIQQFMQLVLQGNVEAVENMLAEDVALVADSNGKATAARNILDGIERVRKFMIGIFTRVPEGVFQVEFTMLNHQPAIVYRQNGEIVRCTIYEVRQGRISNIHFQLNPDKLKNLKKTADLSQG